MPGSDAVDWVAAFLSTLVSAAEDDPIFALLIVLGAAVLVGLGWVALRRYRRTRADRFKQTLKSYDTVAVLMHPDPDPDAMSCALAVQELAETVDTETAAYYSGEIRHHENRAFQTVLSVEFEQIEHAHEVTDRPVVLVDHNEPRGMPGAEKITPVAVVDHHPGGGTGSMFTDVRTDAGACASIITEYFRQLAWAVRDSDDDDGQAPA
jgi:Exopolyphosphatase-related proteins